MRQLFASPLLFRRAAYLGVIVFGLLATLVLVTAQDRASARARDLAVQSAWQVSATSASAPATAAVVYSRFNMKAAANAELTWQAPSAAELRASLRALDAAEIKVTQVKLTRTGSAFLVSAERAP